MYGSEAPEADPGGPGGGSGGLGSGFTKALSVGVVVTWRLLKNPLLGALLTLHIDELLGDQSPDI